MRTPRLSRLAGKTVLITGGAQGIGAQVARQLVAHGARVAVVDCDMAAAHSLTAELGDSATAIEADVTSADSVVMACAAAAEQFGTLDVVVANAGIGGPAATVATVDPAEWRRVIDVNLVGAFHTAHAALPHLRASRGYLLAVASIGAVMPGPTVSGYMVAKAGVDSLVRSLRVELGGTGVDVGIAYFGLVETGLARHLLEHSGMGAVMKTMPAMVSQPIPVDQAAGEITSGIARRARRVYAPWWVPILVDLRTPLLLGDRLMAAWPGMQRRVTESDQIRP